MQSGASHFSGKGRSIISGSATPRAKAEEKPKAAPREPDISPLPTMKAARSIACSLKPGDKAMYRHRQTRDSVTVTRFARREMWEDKNTKQEKNPTNGNMEYAKEYASPAEVEIKPTYTPGFLFPALALDIAYEWDAELPQGDKAA